MPQQTFLDSTTFQVIPAGSAQVNISGLEVSNVLEGQGGYSWTDIFLSMVLTNAGNATGGAMLTITVEQATLPYQTNQWPSSGGQVVATKTVETPPLLPGQVLDFTDVLNFQPALIPNAYGQAAIAMSGTTEQLLYRFTVQSSNGNTQSVVYVGPFIQGANVG
jgi:hypothetical protein